MSQQNTATQPLNTMAMARGIYFNLDDAESLLCIREGQKVDEALKVAQTLSSGVHQLALRLSAAVDDGNSTFIAELEALALLSCISSSLVSASRCSIAAQSERYENVSRHKGGEA